MDKKNIIIVMVDAFRPKNMSLFGYKRETDPNLKKLGQKSIVFRNFFSTSNCTAPSLTSLFTGRFVQNHGIIHQLPYTKTEEIENFERNVGFWLPSYLQNKGYETIAIDWIGLWFKRGFNYYNDKKKENPNKFLNSRPVRRILLNLPSWAYSFGKKMVKARASPKFPTAEQTMDLGISKAKEAIEKNKPFFLFMHFWDTHFPFPTTDFPESEGDKENLNKVLSEIKDEKVKEYFKKRITDIGLNSIEEMIAKYDTAIHNVDTQIGRLQKFLESSGLDEDTLLLVLGDHGTILTEHEIFFSSTTLFDETIHVPCFLKIPEIGKKEIKQFAQNIDLVPTLLEYSGNELNNFEKEMDGLSLRSVIEEDQEIRQRVFSVDGLEEDIVAIRTKNKKLIVAKSPQCNLCKSEHHQAKEEYNLNEDSGEEKNIFSGQSELEPFLNKHFQESPTQKKVLKSTMDYI